MYGYIYKRVNKINGMTYIGQHKYVSEDVKLDKSYKGSGTYFKRALKQYGEDNFSYEIIDTAETAEALNEKERFWIATLNTMVPNGYNITEGGDGIIASPETRSEWARKANKARGTGWKQSEKQKEIVRAYMTQREITDEFRQNCSKAKQGNDNGSGNRGMIWITDGVNNYKIHPGELYDTTIFKPGRTLSQETLNKLAQDYADRIYVHKDNITKNIKKSDLNSYIELGYELGRNKQSYKQRGASISKAKKGAIKVINSSGKVKYIRPTDEEAFKKEGFYRTTKK